MKKFLISIVFFLFFMPAFAQDSKISAEYLKNRKHFSAMNPFLENVVEKVIKTKLKKEIGKGKYRVKFDGYTFRSMKRGIFKNLEITGKNIIANGIEIPYLKLINDTDYNWIDFSEKKIKIKSDISFKYEIELTEKSINTALEQNDFKNTIQKINKKAYPLFAIENFNVRTNDDKVFLIMDYMLPLSGSNKIRRFIVSTKFKIDNGKIIADNIEINTSYGNIPIEKIANLINLLDPLTFTLTKINEQNCKSQIEDVIIKDDIIKINGKIFIKGE